MYQKSDRIAISRGNSKIGKIPNVSLVPKASCAADAPCRWEGCYSMKAYQRFESVRDARLHNMRVWMSEPDRYFSDIDDYLGFRKPSYFRWHVDGDFPEQAYLDRMIDVCRDHRYTRFLAFTKRYQFDWSHKSSNLIIIPSAWPGYELPESVWVGNIAWMLDGREQRNARASYECSKKCDQCYACWHIDTIKMDVVLYKH